MSVLYRNPSPFWIRLRCRISHWQLQKLAGEETANLWKDPHRYSRQCQQYFSTMRFAKPTRVLFVEGEGIQHRGIVCSTSRQLFLSHPLNHYPQSPHANRDQDVGIRNCEPYQHSFPEHALRSEPVSLRPPLAKSIVSTP